MKAGCLELKIIDHVAAIERHGVEATKKAIAALSTRLKRSARKSSKSQEEHEDELFWKSFGGWQGDGTTGELIHGFNS